MVGMGQVRERVISCWLYFSEALCSNLSVVVNTSIDYVVDYHPWEYVYRTVFDYVAKNKEKVAFQQFDMHCITKYSVCVRFAHERYYT